MGFEGRIIAALLWGALSLLALPVATVGQEVPYWPTAQEQRLKEVDAQVLDVQRQRFRALFGQDHEAAERLDKQFKELQKERRALLRVTERTP